ncbi:MAG TPA: ABC transporter substrate-binding protein [Solirubrobacteraceae bacterium]|nr:ABC transporter substrate-binding protein [Solirubrobacteraceae bacterium]
MTGSTLDVVAAQPPGDPGQVDKDVLAGEQLALKQADGKAGPFTVDLRVAHGNEVSATARSAVQDKKAIAYLGEIGPGTSGVSLQITNQVGLLQLSPTDTAVYLTQATPGVHDSPNHYYPASGTFHRTFARVVPTTAQEAKALASDMRARHVSRLYVSGDGTAYGTSVGDEVRQAARAAGLTIVAAPSGADGIFYGGLDGSSAAQALGRLAAANPTAKLFAPSALYDDTLVAKLSPAAQQNLYVSAPGLPATGQDALAKAFTSDFQSTYGHAPQPQAVYGYETTAALLAVLKQLGANANSRARVVAAFRGLKDRPSALGTYSLKNGDTDLASFVIAHPAGGRLVPRSSP